MSIKSSFEIAYFIACISKFIRTFSIHSAIIPGVGVNFTAKMKIFQSLKQIHKKYFAANVVTYNTSILFNF